MNISETVTYLKHFNRAQIYQMVHREEIPYKNTGGQLVFNQQEIESWNKKRLLGLESNKGFMTLKETMVYLGVEKRTLYQWKCEGKIPSHKRGKFLMFNKQELDDWNTNGRPNIDMI